MICERGYAVAVVPVVAARSEAARTHRARRGRAGTTEQGTDGATVLAGSVDRVATKPPTGHGAIRAIAAAMTA
jgi:hypothetical protein